MYSILLADAIRPAWANFGARSNICEYRTRSSTWSKINSRTSHRVVAEVAVSREVIMEEEATEEGAGLEELADEAEAEAEIVDWVDPHPRDHDEELYGFEKGLIPSLLHATSLFSEINILRHLNIFRLGTTHFSGPGPLYKRLPQPESASLYAGLRTTMR